MKKIVICDFSLTLFFLCVVGFLNVGRVLFVCNVIYTHRMDVCRIFPSKVSCVFKPSAGMCPSFQTKMELNKRTLVLMYSPHLHETKWLLMIKLFLRKTQEAR